MGLLTRASIWRRSGTSRFWGCSPMRICWVFNARINPTRHWPSTSCATSSAYRRAVRTARKRWLRTRCWMPLARMSANWACPMEGSSSISRKGFWPVCCGTTTAPRARMPRRIAMKVGRSSRCSNRRRAACLSRWPMWRLRGGLTVPGVRSCKASWEKPRPPFPNWTTAVMRRWYEGTCPCRNAWRWRPAGR